MFLTVLVPSAVRQYFCLCVCSYTLLYCAHEMHKGNARGFVRRQRFDHPDIFCTNVVFWIWTFVQILGWMPHTFLYVRPQVRRNYLFCLGAIHVRYSILPVIFLIRFWVKFRQVSVTQFQYRYFVYVCVCVYIQYIQYINHNDKKMMGLLCIECLNKFRLWRLHSPEYPPCLCSGKGTHHWCWHVENLALWFFCQFSGSRVLQ